jgi:hypothetical protein
MICNTLVQWKLEMAMRKPAGIISIAFGMPGRFAHDEDQFGEGRGDNGDGDIATDAIYGIAQSLHRGGPSTVRDMRAFIDALESMCQAFMDKDRSAFEDAASDACEAMRTLID